MNCQPYPSPNPYFYRCGNCHNEWGMNTAIPLCQTREPGQIISETYCTDEQCAQGHHCQSGCQKDYDCPCLAEHPRQEDSVEKTLAEHDVMFAPRYERAVSNYLFNAFKRI